MDVDYGYYVSRYQGALSEEDFNVRRVKAAAYLSAVTFGRVDETTPPDAAKLAFCAVIDAYCASSSGAVAAESNDGVSVTYVQGEGPAKTEAQRLREAVSLYLAGTDLLYRGC